MYLPKNFFTDLLSGITDLETERINRRLRKKRNGRQVKRLPTSIQFNPSTVLVRIGDALTLDCPIRVLWKGKAKDLLAYLNSRGVKTRYACYGHVDGVRFVEFAVQRSAFKWALYLLKTEGIVVIVK